MTDLPSPEQKPPEPPEFTQSLRTALEADPSRLHGVETPEDVETIALEILDILSEGQDLMDRIKTARDRGDEDQGAIRERGKLWREVMIEVSLSTGVEIEAAEHEAQKETYRSNLKELLASIDPIADDEAIMQKLGIIRRTEDGQRYVFSFPSRVFPPYIKEQWETYLGMVKQFKDAKRKLQAGIITQDDFNGIDRVRNNAHNTVSQSAGEILEFEGWQLEDYRRLLGKMRNGKLAEPSGEMAVYAELFRQKAHVPEHLTAIHRHLGKHGHRNI